MDMDFKKNSYKLGGTIGLLIPVVIYLLLLIIAYSLKSFLKIEPSDYLDHFKLIAIVVNLFPMRYYFLKLKFDLTGRSILLVTFVYIVVYFWFQ